MHNIKIKIYNPDTGKRIPIIPPIPLSSLPFFVKMGQKFAKKADKEAKKANLYASEFKERMSFSLDKLSKAEIKFFVKELKSCAPFTIVDIKENGKPVVNISIT